MKDIVETSLGAMWREVESSEEANHIGKATQTAFGVYFDMERKRGVVNRYFALGEDFKVIGRVPPQSGESKDSLGPAKIFVAHANADPFPTYAQEIAELAQVIGTSITAQDYPYRRTEADLEEDLEEDLSDEAPDDSEAPRP